MDYKIYFWSQLGVATVGLIIAVFKAAVDEKDRDKVVMSITTGWAWISPVVLFLSLSLLKADRAALGVPVIVGSLVIFLGPIIGLFGMLFSLFLIPNAFIDGGKKMLPKNTVLLAVYIFFAIKAMPGIIATFF